MRFERKQKGHNHLYMNRMAPAKDREPVVVEVDEEPIAPEPKENAFEKSDMVMIKKSGIVGKVIDLMLHFGRDEYMYFVKPEGKAGLVFMERELARPEMENE